MKLRSRIWERRRRDGRAFRSGLGAAALTAALAVLAPAASADPSLTKVGTFDAPIYATGAPGDDRRLFVVERGGTIRVLRDGEKVGRPFLRIPGGVSTDGERGLQSMAFAPGYERNRRFYVFYTAPGNGALRVDEFKRSKRTRNRAVRSSRRAVLRIPHPGFSNHNGGQLQFGPDRLLYVSTGDGGGAGDENRNAQDRSSLLGKILRIDPRRKRGRSYTVPRSNPFVGRRGRDEIYHYGLRNPFRFSFDRARGDLTVGDVGQSEVEEVNFRRRNQPGGANFGWNCFEGSRRYRGENSVGKGCLKGRPHVEPVLERFHSDGGVCSITGGYVARHRSLGALQGRYVYGDFCSGQIRSVALRQPRAVGDAAVGLSVPGLNSFGEGPRGRLYAVSLEGEVFRIRG